MALVALKNGEYVTQLFYVYSHVKKRKMNIYYIYDPRGHWDGQGGLIMKNMDTNTNTTYEIIISILSDLVREASAAQDEYAPD